MAKKTYEQVIEEAREAIRTSSKESSVYIGTDSIKFRKGDRWFATYSTCIILHMNSKNGGKMFHHTVTMPEYGKTPKDLKMRLMNEAGFAIQAALDVLDCLDGRRIEIHLDLNADPIHRSNSVVKEACGYVLGSTGIQPEIKPHAFAATHAGDHIVRGKHLAH